MLKGMVGFVNWLPALLLAAYCLWTGAIQFRDGFLDRAPTEPGTTRQERYHARFERARHALSGMDVVGYVRVGPREQHFFGRSYYFAKYALAPTLLSSSLQNRYVLGDFDSPERRDAFLKETGLRILEDLGGGLVLLENRRAR